MIYVFVALSIRKSPCHTVSDSSEPICYPGEEGGEREEYLGVIGKKVAGKSKERDVTERCAVARDE